ncbi:MAG: class I SAM-dependent methyltransferase [Oscillospiraceae bacterium]|jgi:23S rRNA (cytosine1962-C5)-methyltransferase|nr:class I SAM-dependent methyltransferase [Oscillospiraceae bacterium]
MLIANNWKDYELLDCSDGERLERWGNVILIRPDPQVIWNTPRDKALWGEAHAIYKRSAQGGGAWQYLRKFKEPWSVSWGDLTFACRCMGFKHTGVFPEQAVNWARLQTIIRAAERPVRVLNLFAYTGAASIACAAAGAAVTHVDAAKGMLQWARENAALSALADAPIRRLVDDCGKFVQRELRRGNKYDIIIMDPPSYGRGPGGEVWKLEQEIHPLIRDCAGLLADNALAVLVNSYTTGLSPSVMAYIMHAEIAAHRGGTIDCDELGLPVSSMGMALPCGASAFWKAEC